MLKKNPEKMKRKPSVKPAPAAEPQPRSELPKPVSAANRIHQSSISPSPIQTNRLAVSAIELKARDPSHEPANNKKKEVQTEREDTGAAAASSNRSRDLSRDRPAPVPSVGQILLQSAENSRRQQSKEKILRPGNERAVSRDSLISENRVAAEPKQMETVAPPVVTAQPNSVGAAPTGPKPITIRGTLVDGWHRVEFENGVYEGYVKDNKRHGEGSYVWSDGSRYQGQWSDDLKHGTGKFVWPTGDIFEGEYHRDKRHGPGIKTYASGDRYEVFDLADRRESGPTETRKVVEHTPLPTVTCTTACSRTTRKRATV